MPLSGLASCCQIQDLRPVTPLRTCPVGPFIPSSSCHLFSSIIISSLYSIVNNTFRTCILLLLNTLYFTQLLAISRTYVLLLLSGLLSCSHYSQDFCPVATSQNFCSAATFNTYMLSPPSTLIHYTYIQSFTHHLYTTYVQSFTPNHNLSPLNY